MNRALALAGMLAALVLPAVAGAKERPLTVIASEYQFAPATLTFTRGVAYRLHIENRGREMHEFTAREFFRSATIRDPGVLNADMTEIEIPPGMAKDLVFVPRQAGRYPLRCSDHDWAGMTGQIIVK